MSQIERKEVLKIPKDDKLNLFQIANAKVKAFLAKGGFKTIMVKGKKYYCFNNNSGEIVLSPIRANLPNLKIRQRFEDVLFCGIVAEQIRGIKKSNLLDKLNTLLIHEQRLDFTSFISHFSAIDQKLKTELLNGDKNREIRLDSVIGVINIMLKVQDLGFEHKISDLLHLTKIKFRKELGESHVTGKEVVYVLGKPIEIGTYTKLTRVMKKLKENDAYTPEKALEIAVLLGQLGTKAKDLRDYLKADLRKHDSSKAIYNTIFKHFDGKKIFLNPALI